MFEPATVEKVLGHLLRFGSSRAEAPDLAQETLLIAWRKRDERDETRPLDAWLYGIARNVYRNHARRARRTPITSDDVELATTAHGGATVDEVIALQRAVAALPDDQQELVIGHLLEGLTLKDTAARLDVPFDTAKDRLRRARETLQGRLGDGMDVAVESERARTHAVAKAVVATVLLGLARPAAAATGAKLVLVGVFVAGIATGVVGDRVLTTPPPIAALRNVPTVVAMDAGPHEPDATMPDAATPPADALVRDAAPAPMLDVDAEAQLIERARVAVRSGRTDDAVRALVAHQRRFAGGQLVEERELLWIEADILRGELTSARARIERFHLAYPASAHDARIEQAAQQLAPP